MNKYLYIYWSITITLIVVVLIVGPNHINAQELSTTPYLVRDILDPDIGVFPTASSYPSALFSDGDIVLFMTQVGGTQQDLWRTDGSLAGTYKLLSPQVTNAYSWIDVDNLAALQGQFYFIEAVNHPFILWSSDGSVAGTKQVTLNIESASYFLQNLVMVGDTLYFTSSVLNDSGDDAHIQLWKVVAGSHVSELVYDFGTVVNFNLNSPKHFVALQNALLFIFNHSELWRSDGTRDGTKLVQDTLPSAQALGMSVAELTVVDNNLYFRTVSDRFVPNSLNNLWVSDGTTSGTRRIGSISPTYPYEKLYLTDVEGRLYFTAYDEINGAEVWTSDGTEGGTKRVTDISPGNNMFGPTALTPVDGSLYFNMSSHNSSDDALWRLDAIDEQPALVSDRSIYKAIAVGNRLYFLHKPQRTDGLFQVELWMTNAQSEPILIRENTHAGEMFEDQLSIVNDWVVFIAQDIRGVELWRSDGTINGTRLIKDINTQVVIDNTEIPEAPTSSDPKTFTAFGDQIYFTAELGGNFNTLWVSDGTLTNTMQIENSLLNAESGDIIDIFATGDFVFFVKGGQFNQSNTLWRTDGASEGTLKLHEFETGPNAFVVYNGATYFAADDGTQGGLWKSDGSPNGTVLVKSFRFSLNGGIFDKYYPPEWLIVHQGHLFFSGQDVDHGRELWSSDGTTDGTMLVTDLFVGQTSSRPSQITSIGQYLFFTAHTVNGSGSNSFCIGEDANNNTEIWRLNDVSTPPVPVVKSTCDPQALVFPRRLTQIGEQLYYGLSMAGEDSSINEIWLIHDVDNPVKVTQDLSFIGGMEGQPLLMELGDAITFIATDGLTRNDQIWKIARNGLTQISSFTNEGRDTTIREIQVVNNTLFFTVDNGLIGEEIWWTDGSPGCVLSIADLNMGIASSKPQHLIPRANTLHFSADDGEHGQELWAVDVPKPRICNFIYLPKAHR
ncbi:MAG: hypothetical protein R3A44_34215 [Caldilineaceae bacterium]